MGNTISGGKEKQKNNEIEALGGNNVYKWSKRTEKLTKKETEKYNNQLSLQIEELKLKIKQEEKKKNQLLKEEEEKGVEEEESSEEDEEEKNVSSIKA